MKQTDMTSQGSPDTTAIMHSRPDSTFPIVGVGASAGGLGAITLLLRHLGESPGVAIVLVVHLDPARPSDLVELLGRTTSMPVEAATEGAAVRIGHVYVIPPGAEITLQRGVLRLTPRTDRPGLHLPIDVFFDSLAADAGARAVAVVLSGTGADGARGIQAIKAEGGLSFAQKGAEHTGMPESAVATRCIDFCLPVEDIAVEIARIGAPAASPGDSDEADAFRRILTAIRNVAGVDFAHYKPTTLRRRMQRRAILRRVGTLREYADLVMAEPAEVEALSEEVLIHVTSFFRDAELFDALKADVFPRLLAGPRAEDAIRVWVPGCSSGEEVYSIAICLAEFLATAGAPQVPVKMFGTDVSRRAIERARAGIYPETIAEDVSPARLARFFVKTERGYEILKEVRDRCVFATHDIARDPPFSKMDLISCRNLMIYFGQALQQRVLPMFHYALNEHGFLVLGTSETIGAFVGFSAADAKNKIYARERGPARLAFEYGYAASRAAPSSALPRVAIATSGGDLRKDADRAILAAVAPAGVVVTDSLAIVEFRGDIARYLEPTAGLATLDLLRMAREDLRLTLRRTIDEARTTGNRTESRGVLSTAGEVRSSVDIDVVPFTVAPSSARFFAVLFHTRPAPPGDQGVAAPASAGPAPVSDSLRQELASTREYLQSVIAQLEAGNEELKAANEEIVSFNEELQSTNEELQTAKEELQATNEELRTVNDEMQDRNVESTRLADDLSNVLSSVAIPIVILGRESQIRRFTPTATKILRLIGTDIGRPITDIQAKIRIDDLPGLVSEVLRELVPLERTVQSEDGRWYQLEIRPYRTHDNRIDGTVLSVYDIDARKRAELLLSEARDYAESIVDTMRECLVVLDRDLRVCSANRAFCETFSVTPAILAGERFGSIAGRRWAVPVLTALLESLTRGEQPADIRMECEVAKMGLRTMLVNGRRMAKTGQVLLTMSDITDRVRMEDRLAKSEAGFRLMLASAAGAIVMSDATGRIVFANEMAKTTFGYGGDEMLALHVDDLLPGALRAGHAHLRLGFLAAPTPRPMGRDRNLTALRKDGSEFPIEVALSPMEGSEGELVVAFVADVTARREAELRIADYQAKLRRTVSESALTEERERRQIARDLHDRVGQSLALARIKLEGARQASTGELRVAMDAAIELVTTSIADTRTLTFELAPPVLYDLGLKAALSWLAEDIEKRSGLHVVLTDDDTSASFDDATAALLFRGVRELLTNVFKHAHVPTASIALAQDEGDFQIRVEDKGRGFDVEKVARGPTAGFGLFSVREQLVRLGGTVDIASTPEHGTTVTLRVPIVKPEPSVRPDGVVATS